MPETEVWRSGMTEWVPATSVPGLIPVRSVAGSANEKRAPMVEMPEVNADVVRVLAESRAWVIFIAVVAFSYAALLGVAGILGILLGARAGMSPITIQGFGSLIGGIVIAVGGFLLMRYVGGISRFERRSREPNLAAALSALKTFWVYVGIVLIPNLELDSCKRLLARGNREKVAWPAVAAKVVCELVGGLAF